MHEKENGEDLSARLVSRIQTGDQAAESELYQSYQRTLLYLLRRRTNNSDVAEDLLQDTFRVAIEQIRRGRINEPGRLPSFLHGIALNVFRRWLRSNKSGRFRSVDDPAFAMELVAQNRNPHEEFSAKEKQKKVIGLIMELRARDRDVLISLFLNEETPEEVCRKLSLTRKNLSLILWRARQRLRQRYDQREASPARAS